MSKKLDVTLDKTECHPIGMALCLSLHVRYNKIKPKKILEQKYNLGWTEIEYDASFNLDKGENSEYEFDDFGEVWFDANKPSAFFDSISYKYRNLHKLVINESCLFYKLKTPWYISEMSEVIGNAIPFYDKIIFQTPSFRELRNFQIPNPFILGVYKEKMFERFNTAKCYFSFFREDALLNIIDVFKDSVQNKEIGLIPNLDAYGNEDEGLNIYEYGDYDKISFPTYQKLNQLPKFGFFQEEKDISENDKLIFPLIICDNPYNLIQLRRGELESFNKMKNYASELLESKNFNHKELIEAISEGYEDYNSRLKHIKTKGFLTRIGGTILPIATSFGMLIDGNMISRSGILMSVSTTAFALRTIIDQYYAEKKIKDEPFQFLRVAKKIGKWK